MFCQELNTRLHAHQMPRWAIKSERFSTALRGQMEKHGHDVINACRSRSLIAELQESTPVLWRWKHEATCCIRAALSSSGEDLHCVPHQSRRAQVKFLGADCSSLKA